MENSLIFSMDLPRLQKSILRRCQIGAGKLWEIILRTEKSKPFVYIEEKSRSARGYQDK